MQDNIYMLPVREPIELEHTSTHHLPTQLTPLIGREQEVAAACTLLRRSKVRLLTITGAGGVGKTRLALQVVTTLVNDFADGVYFVPFAPISEADLVMPTIAQALGVKEGAERSFLDLLKVFLKDKHLLLLLDNFEQIQQAAPHLTDLLAYCPDLKLLITSRAVLHVQGEHEFPVPPLAIPNLTLLPEPEVLAHYAAIALFLQRAQAVKPTFQMTAANTRPIAEICVHLDGLPLAIELAAARTKLLPPQALLARLGRRFEILTSGAQDVPERQQTLRNTIAWSYQLLDDSEKRLFRQLSVFVGGCTLAAVEAVVAAFGTNNEIGHVLDGIASLLDKSLLQQTEQEGEEPRLALLETIQEYGLECLVSMGELEATRAAHAEYYLTLAEQEALALGGSQQAPWLDRLEREYNNLRTALLWLMEPGRRVGAGSEAVELALHLGTALCWFWIVRGHQSDGRQWSAWVQAARNGNAAARAKALHHAAMLAYTQDEHDLVEVLCNEGLSLCQELGDRVGMARSLQWLGAVEMYRSNYPRSRSLLEEALALFKQTGDKEGISYCLDDLAFGATNQGAFDRAYSLAEEALVLFRELSDERGITYALLRLARCHYLCGNDIVRAYALAEESLMISRKVGYKWGIGSSLGLLGQLALHRGDESTARSLLEEALAVRQEVRRPWGIAWGIYCLADLAAVQSDYVTARTHYVECLALLRELDDKEFTASCLEGLGVVVVAQGDEDGSIPDILWAARLWGTAEAIREAIGAPIPPIRRARYEQAIAIARTQLGEQAFVAAWAEGQIMTPQHILAVQGEVMIPTTMPTRPATPPMKSPSFPAGLTAREVDVLHLIAQGRTDAQIAEKLVISPRTVNKHTTSLYSKLGVSSRAAATRFALEHHLL